MAKSDDIRSSGRLHFADDPNLDWDKCNVCGMRFKSWSKLWKHKTEHTPAEIDARTIGSLKHKKL